MSPIANLLGGVGLFLLGMHLMTEGLKLTAGHALRTVLARSTGTRLRGVLSGTMITSLVQSSSAVTIATIGFVNAGLLTLPQAVAITYGSNIGTTMTGWLVAIIGFHFKIQMFALPAIGVGMFMRLAGPRGQRLAAIGEALAGFGIFFLAIDMLKGGFTGLGQHLPLASANSVGPLDLVLFVGSGFVMTVLTQSSSAAIALILTAAGSGVLAIEAAAAMVIGANIGTTSTAVLAAVGATPNARRMAAAHVLFNVITGIVALIILPLMLALLHLLQTKLDLESGTPVLLALFHTVFNLLGVALLWPFTGLLVRKLEERFRPKEDDEARPRYLDRTIVATPVLALQALTLELGHIGHIVVRMARLALAGDAPMMRLERDAAIVEQLIDAVGDFTALMRRGSLSAPLAEILPNAIGISRYFRDTTALTLAVSRIEPTAMVPELAEPIAQFRRSTQAVIDAAAEPESFDEAASLQGRQALSRQYEELKSHTLQLGSLGHVPVRQVVELVEIFKDSERMASYLVKAASLLAAMRAVAANRPPSPEADAETMPKEDKPAAGAN